MFVPMQPQLNYNHSGTSPSKPGNAGIPLPPPTTPPSVVIRPAPPRLASNGPEMKSNVTHNSIPQPPTPVAQLGKSPTQASASPSSTFTGSLIREYTPQTSPVSPSYTSTSQYLTSPVGTQTANAQHSTSTTSVMNGAKGTPPARTSAKIMIPSLAPPPSLISTMNSMTQSTQSMMSSPTVLHSPLMGTMDYGSSRHMGSPMSLRATVLIPSPPPAPQRNMQSMYNTMSVAERQELYSILVENGFSVEQLSGVHLKCGGCGATSRGRSKCPCGFNNAKRKPRRLFLPPSDVCNDDSSDGNESPKNAIKRIKRSPKPNTKYLDAAPTKIMTRKPPMKSCPSCDAPCHTAKTQCSKCGHSFPRKPRKPKHTYPYYSPERLLSLDDKDKDLDRKGTPKRLCLSCHGWVPCSARFCDCGASLHFDDDKKKSGSRKRAPQDMDEIPVELWSEADACGWLMTFPFGEQYLPKFHENNVDGIILLEMNENLMRDELGVENAEHRRMMLESLHKPRQKRNKKRLSS